MEIQLLEKDYIIAQVKSIDVLKEITGEYFTAVTNEEISIVCEQGILDEKHLVKSTEAYRLFKINDVLDFSLIGIISNISTILKENKISIFVVSTYNTDYFLVRKKDTYKTIECLQKESYHN